MAAVWMDAWGLFGMERAEGSGKVSLRGPEQPCTSVVVYRDWG